MSRDQNAPNEPGQVRKYEFAAVRYVHDISTHEFVNIGVVLWVPQTFSLHYQVNEHYSRISRFFPEFDGESYRQMIKALISAFESVSSKLRNQELFSSPPDRIEGLLSMLLPFDDSCFQWSPIMSGVSDEPEKRFNKLLYDFVTRNERDTPRERRDEAAIWRYVFDKVSRSGLATKVDRDVEVSTRLYSYPFRMGWTNGKRQVLEPISFDLSDTSNIKEKANNWVGRLHTLSRDNDFQMTAVITGPQDSSLKGAFEDGHDILHNSPTIRKLLKEEEVDDFLDVVRSEVN